MTLSERRAAILILARNGNVRDAIEAGEDLIRDFDGDPGFRLFLGLMWARIGQPLEGVAHLRRALDLAPNDLVIRMELARTLSTVGDVVGVDAVCAGYGDVQTPIGRNFLRIEAHSSRCAGQHAKAERLFDSLTSTDDADYESWYGLGDTRLSLGRVPDATVAFLRAIALRPDLPDPAIALANAYALTDNIGAGLDAARQAVRLARQNPRAHLTLARLLAMSGQTAQAVAQLEQVQSLISSNPELLCDSGDVASLCLIFDRAEIMYRSALAIAPRFLPAYLCLGDLLERTNQIDALSDLLDLSNTHGISFSSTAALRARLLRRRGQLAEALVALEAADASIDPMQRAHLSGDIADRMGDSHTAFAMFVESNQLATGEGTALRESAATYRLTLKALTDLLTPNWYATWKERRTQDTRAAPIFLFGFPRSGTTLLDTMLLGHPDAVVLEEEPALQSVADMLGPAERLPELRATEIAALRARYFAEVDAIAPGNRDRVIVDKFPLGLVSTPLVHRIFPDARFIFAERHPCDVVLSCFMTRFKLNPGMANFLNLDDTAALYDQVMQYWQRCREIMSLEVATIRYETLIENPENELRRLARFAGLDWTPRLVDHRANAATRGYIGSPSYAQVSEPIYARAVGRWHRYRTQMAPILPILEPWISAMGYSLDP